MATQREYLCEQSFGYDTEITEHMNTMAAQGWELVSAQYAGDRPPHVWLFWRR